MKKIISTCLAVTLMLQAFGQHAKRFTIHAEAGSFLNLNGADIKPNPFGHFFSQQNNAGGYAGAGIRLMMPKIAYFQASTGLRFSPQSITVQDGSFKVNQQYTNMEWYLRLLLGFSFRISEGNKLTLGLGLNNLYSLKNNMPKDQLVTSPYIIPSTGENGNHLSGVSIMNWGDTRSDKILLPFITNGLFQLGYENTTLLPNNRRVGITFEFSSRISPENYNGKGNSGAYYKLDENRNIITSQKYIDNYTAIGLQLAVTLF